jgi:hypothetical protein
VHLARGSADAKNASQRLAALKLSAHDGCVRSITTTLLRRTALTAALSTAVIGAVHLLGSTASCPEFAGDGRDVRAVGSHCVLLTPQR